MIVPIAIKDEKPPKGGRQRWKCYLIIPNMVDFFPPLKCGTRFLEYHFPEVRLVQTLLTFHKILKTPEHGAYVAPKTESYCSIKFASEERPAIM